MYVLLITQILQLVESSGSRKPVSPQPNWQSWVGRQSLIEHLGGVFMLSLSFLSFSLLLGLCHMD